MGWGWDGEEMRRGWMGMWRIFFFSSLSRCRAGTGRVGRAGGGQSGADQHQRPQRHGDVQREANKDLSQCSSIPRKGKKGCSFSEL